jgi:hypothetical protein
MAEGLRQQPFYTNIRLVNSSFLWAIEEVAEWGLRL